MVPRCYLLAWLMAASVLGRHDDAPGLSLSAELSEVRKPAYDPADVDATQVATQAALGARSVVLFQLATASVKAVPTNSTQMKRINGTSVSGPAFPHKASLLGLATELSGKLATALGVTDIVSLCVLGLVVLLALYFVWGGNWNSLQEDPYGELRSTGERAGREAKDKLADWQAQRAATSPGGQDPFATQPAEGGFRRSMNSCC
ncbi:unnamed protein product [Effrenium voratum]|uniref:Uncharacterized protein n=1 Tax=Effrenium voratum TaxID=2562239 RepID=A0AA36N7F5_9DINO|nr:unnamed protein product [Effrenium voratum]